MFFFGKDPKSAKKTLSPALEDRRLKAEDSKGLNFNFGAYDDLPCIDSNPNCRHRWASMPNIAHFSIFAEISKFLGGL